MDSEGTLIQFTVFDSMLKQDYLNFMQSYLKDYSTFSSNCDFETGTRINSSILEPCEFPLSLLGPCADPAGYINSNNNFCLYLKLNKVLICSIAPSCLILKWFWLLRFFLDLDLWIPSWHWGKQDSRPMRPCCELLILLFFLERSSLPSIESIFIWIEFFWRC